MKYFCLFAGILTLAFAGTAAASRPVQVGAAPIHPQGGYEYRLKPGQAMIVSVIKARQTGHVPIKGEDYCPALARILNPAIRPVSVRDDMTFFLGGGAARGLATLVKSGPLRGDHGPAL